MGFIRHPDVQQHPGFGRVSRLAPPARFSDMACQELMEVLGFHAPPPILRRLCLARGSDDPLDPTTVTPGVLFPRIGDEIPPMRLMTVELQYSPAVQKLHNASYLALAACWRLSTGSDPAHR
ncbi:hypothetical protein BDW59DRAFT_156812 [Aspergillus cavernicola]|uniref:Uncharacterized protein n=1 Tax=Aspergillus cavernicola TaxID=176166 RepID=A0ABR4J2M0_9EURO